MTASVKGLRSSHPYPLGELQAEGKREIPEVERLSELEVTACCCISIQWQSAGVLGGMSGRKMASRMYRGFDVIGMGTLWG